ncbi:MAG: winged helix DNA-binding protein [Mucilaginibacter sp.]|nr:winged helix DNA-binding protein [Mucilaginibacter sp.]
MDQNKDLLLASDLRTIVTRLVKKLRKESVTGKLVSLTERSTMSLLYQYKQLLPSELASMEKVTNQSMSQILSYLLELGYISRVSSKADRRKVIISLTPKGEEILLKMRNERDMWLARAIRETCSEQEEALLKKVIDPLTKLVDFE